MTDRSAPTGGGVTQGDAVDLIVRHIQTVMGPISTDTCEVEGDDDRSILLHNIRLIVGQVRLAAIEECAKACDRIATVADGAENIGAQAGAMLAAKAIRNLGRGA